MSRGSYGFLKSQRNSLRSRHLLYWEEQCRGLLVQCIPATKIGFLHAASVHVLSFFCAPTPANQKGRGQMGCRFLSPLPTLSSFLLVWVTLQHLANFLTALGLFCTALFLCREDRYQDFTVYTIELAKQGPGHFSLSPQTFKITSFRGRERKIRADQNISSDSIIPAW